MREIDISDRESKRRSPKFIAEINKELFVTVCEIYFFLWCKDVFIFFYLNTENYQQWFFVFFRFNGLYMIIVSACRNAYEMYITFSFSFFRKDVWKMCQKISFMSY